MGWTTVVSCDVACHIMSLGVLVMSFDAMWLLVLCRVTWCTAMSCDVRSCEELSSIVPCNGMECYEGKLPLFSKQLLCTTKYYSKTTLYFKVLLQCFSSTTPTLLQYYYVLLCTTKRNNAIRNPQRRAQCRATNFFGVRMRRRQHAAHSGVRSAKGRIFFGIRMLLPATQENEPFWVYWLSTLYMLLPASQENEC